jgi:hypothetical protein
MAILGLDCSMLSHLHVSKLFDVSVDLLPPPGPAPFLVGAEFLIQTLEIFFLAEGLEIRRGGSLCGRERREAHGSAGST